jgi:hypothetical protein
VPTAAKPVRHQRFPSGSTREDATGTLPTSSSSSLPVPLAGDGVARRLRQPSIPDPFPPPACVLRESGLSQLFVRGRAESRDTSAQQVQQQQQPKPQRGVAGLQLAPHTTADAPVPRTTLFDAQFGASAIATRRRRVAEASSAAAPDSPAPCGVLCRRYPGAQPGGELWAVVDQVVHASEVATRSWEMAVEVLVGIVINATVDDFEAGFGLCSEVVRRMQGGPPHVAAGIFTLLVNIGAQASFTGPQWRDVERMVLSVFTNVVEAMDASCPATTGVRSGGPGRCRAGGSGGGGGGGGEEVALAWDRAVKCAMALLGSGSRFGDMAAASAGGAATKSANAGTALNWSAGRRPQLTGPAISLRALIALSLRVRADSHPLVEQVLVGEGVWRGFRGPFEEDDDIVRPAVDEDRVFSAFGGIHVITSLYVQCRSLTARRRMFALIFEVAVSRVRSRARASGDQDLVVAENQVSWLYGLLRAYDAGDALVTTFRLGPEETFVMDTLRHMMFEPLSAMPSSSASAAAALAGSKSFSAANGGENSRPSGNFMRGLSSAAGASPSLDDKDRSAANEHRSAILAANRQMNKRFVLSVLIQLEGMAGSFSKQNPPRHESGGAHGTVELTELKTAELRRDGRSHALRSPRHVWQGLHSACAASLTDSQPRREDVITVMEQTLSMVLLPLPFANVLSDGADSEAEAFLCGERRLLVGTSSTECADMLVSLLYLSTPFIRGRHVSELRQSLVEILGSSPSHAHRVAQFSDDADALVAYRARCIAPDGDFPTSDMI